MPAQFIELVGYYGPPELRGFDERVLLALNRMDDVCEEEGGSCSTLVRDGANGPCLFIFEIDMGTLIEALSDYAGAPIPVIRWEVLQLVKEGRRVHQAQTTHSG